MPFCENCGTEVGMSQFCPSCGKPQGKTQPYSGGGQSQQASTPQPVQPVMPNIIITQQSQQTPVNAGINQYPPPSTAFGRKDGAMAAVLSFLIPGLGQIYVGNAGRGIAIFFSTVCLFFFFIGIIEWIWQIFDANQQTKIYNQLNR